MIYSEYPNEIQFSCFQCADQSSIILFHIINMNQNNIQVEQNSTEWNQITYQLQIATGEPAVKLLNLYRLPVYMERMSHDNTLDALVDLTDLKSQFKTRVIEKNIPLDDLIFICGQVNLEKYRLQPTKVFKFLLCEVILGKTAPLSQGFTHADSLLIQPDNPNDPYHYNMLVKNHSQYTAKYEISFVFGDELQLQQSPIICVYCGTKTATIYCIDQRKYYCDSCSYNLHPHPPPPQNNKKSKYVPPRHQVQKVNRTNSLPLCESHGSRFELYCTKCQKYLCDQCARQPLHSQNPEHPVRPLQYLYTQKRQTNTRLPIKPKQNLLKLLQISNEKSKLIIKNYEQVKRQLIYKFEKAMNDLQWQYKQRLVRVQSDLINLQMQLEKIKWDNSFVRSQEEILKPIHYFKIQSRYENDMREMKIKRYGNSFDVEPDIDHYSVIEVANRQKINQYKLNTVRTLQKSRTQRRVNGHTNQNTDDKAKKQLKLVTFDPDCQPTRRGDLSVFLENSGIKFFKVESRNR